MKDYKPLIGLLVIVVVLSFLNYEPREASLDQFELRLTEEDAYQPYYIGDADFRMKGFPIYTCGELPIEKWVSYTGDKECWDQSIKFLGETYIIHAEEPFELNDYLSVTWMPSFTMEVEEDGRQDFFRLNSIFSFKFINYDFLDIEINRKRYGVVDKTFPVALNIDNSMFGIPGKIVHNYVEKKMGIETSKNINIKFIGGQVTQTLYYPSTYVGDVDSDVEFVLIVPDNGGTRELTTSIKISDSYRVLAVEPSENPLMTITPKDNVIIEDEDTDNDDVEQDEIEEEDTIDINDDEDNSSSKGALIILLVVGLLIFMVMKNR